ncbi:hypothetical protein E2C01_031994 [Portunus trituberculatus]|uniref:Uncharacterized protein n=1 Tax=Portunus trituberculatus TaxID=210409 RepID=A0A5B7EZ57_PORTR|nr:hypothetical protein [Portunus trituberculatus]
MASPTRMTLALTAIHRRLSLLSLFPSCSSPHFLPLLSTPLLGWWVPSGPPPRVTERVVPRLRFEVKGQGSPTATRAQGDKESGILAIILSKLSVAGDTLPRTDL